MEPALNLAKFIFILKHSVKLRRYLLCGCVAACHGMECVSHATHTETCRSDIYVYFNVNFKVFFKLIKMNLLVSEIYIYKNVRRNNKNEQ